MPSPTAERRNLQTGLNGRILVAAGRFSWTRATIFSSSQHLYSICLLIMYHICTHWNKSADFNTHRIYSSSCCLNETKLFQSCSSLVRLDVSFIPPRRLLFIIKMSRITASPECSPVSRRHGYRSAVFSKLFQLIKTKCFSSMAHFLLRVPANTDSSSRCRYSAGPTKTVSQQKQHIP